MHLPCLPLCVSIQDFCCSSLPRFSPRPFTCSVLDATATMSPLTKLTLHFFHGNNLSVCLPLCHGILLIQISHWPPLNQRKVSTEAQTGTTRSHTPRHSLNNSTSQISKNFSLSPERSTIVVNNVEFASSDWTGRVTPARSTTRSHLF